MRAPWEIVRMHEEVRTAGDGKMVLLAAMFELHTTDCVPAKHLFWIDGSWVVGICTTQCGNAPSVRRLLGKERQRNAGSCESRYSCECCGH